MTRVWDGGPIFWERAAGAIVWDVDGNRFVDLTAGFGVAAAGHANPRVVDAIARQCARLPHALGDIQPAAMKVELMELLAEIAPGDLSVTLLGSAGAEAVEAALKTALLATGKPGVIAFEGSYHGLTYGALSVTGRREFAAPFGAQLFGGVAFARFPEGGAAEARLSLAEVDRRAEEAELGAFPIGAVIVEPIQGRGGLIEPPADFLPGLRRLCDRRDLVLIVDEIYTGIGRTGRWFACDHSGVVPDIVTLGKGLTGSLPLSAAIGRPEIMRAWPPSAGEALHTSTFLGNPVSCAAAIAQLTEIETRGLVQRAAEIGSVLRGRLEGWLEIPGVQRLRGRGLLQGVVMSQESDDGVAAGRGPATAPGATLASRVADLALRDGVLVLTEGPLGDVLAITPPLVITEEQLETALEVLERALRRLAGEA